MNLYNIGFCPNNFDIIKHMRRKISEGRVVLSAVVCLGAFALWAERQDGGASGTAPLAAAVKAAGLTAEFAETCVTDGCLRVNFNLKSAPDSLIRCVAEFPPADKWNGNLWGFGNGGPGGGVNPRVVHGAARSGSAAVHTDMGTSRYVATPTMIRDFGHLSTHLMTVAAKAMVAARYGRPAKHAYFKGGSTGGGQGFHEALRYPDDYDGIISMVPANTRLPLHVYFAWNARECRDAAGRPVFTKEQEETIRRAGLEALSDEQPAFARGKYLVDPTYTPARERKVIARIVALDPSLDTPDIRRRLHRLFEGPVIGGRHIHSGVPFGSSVAGACGNQWMLQWWLPKGREPWTVTDEELLRWEREYAPDCDAYDDDVDAFVKRGGKWIVCGGLEDSVVPVPSMIDWYGRAAKRYGGIPRFAKTCRFFLMPGHAHGAGRGMKGLQGVDQALVAWVEKGKAPASLAADMQDGTLLTVQAYPAKPYAEVRVKSTLDGQMRPTWFWAPTAPKDRIPLLVALHSWSYDFRGPSPRDTFVRECMRRGWAFLAPDFRGPNKTPEGCGSDLAVQDIVDAVEWAKTQVSVDPDRVYLVGGSGGGMMTLLMAGRHPDVWAGCYAACPISDIARWRDETLAMGDWRARYGREIETACGGTPETRREEYARRSPLTHLGAARAAGTHVDICEGIHDGHIGSVPVGHAIRAFNALADEQDRISETDIATIERTEDVPPALAFAGTDPFFGKKKVFLRRESANVRLTLFDAGHAGNYAEAIDWLARQRRGRKVDWTVPETATAVGGNAEVTK